MHTHTYIHTYKHKHTYIHTYKYRKRRVCDAMRLQARVVVARHGACGIEAKVRKRPAVGHHRVEPCVGQVFAARQI